MFLGAVLGCKTTYYGVVEKKSEPLPLQPMTVALVDYLGASAVRDFQYYLSSRIVLSKEDFDRKYENVNGSLKLDNTYSRETVEIDEYTKGIVVSVGTNDEGKLVLAACFSRNPELTLRFIQSGDGDRFDLETQDGTTLYGNTRYRVLHDENFTRLLINVESGGRIVGQPRREPGRSLWDEKSSSESKPVQSAAVLPRTEPEEEYFPDGETFPEAAEPPETAFFDPAVPDTRFSASPVRYRVQVGAFRNPDNAWRTVERLQIAGLNPSCIQQDEYYRVAIGGVAEEDMPNITQQLSFAGFFETWIQEEK
jgi:hypothetical protein